MRAEEHTQALPAGTSLNTYVIDEVLGAGGFGITYRATERITERIVAIKEYLPKGIAVRARDGWMAQPISASHKSDFNWGLDRFRLEARMLTRLKHPNIVSALSYFEANETGYLVMEYQDGQNLGDRLRNEGTLTEGELLEIIDPLLSGIEEIHRNRLVHRDIKPENVLIRRDGAPVLLDFGAARQALAAHSHSLTAILTDGYAPPEQYESRGNQGPWTDIYAVGALMYHCLRGERPKSALDRLRPPDPLVHGLDGLEGFISARLLNAVRCALAVYEADRPQSVAALRDLIWPPAADTIVVGSRPTAEIPLDQIPRRRIEVDHPRAAGGRQFLRHEYRGKYLRLHKHLLELGQSEWRASFDEIEHILRFKLPRSARHYQAWWANQSGGPVQCLAWMAAGWRTSQIDLGGEKVTFLRHSD